jgi:hypothetical protein
MIKKISLFKKYCILIWWIVFMKLKFITKSHTLSGTGEHPGKLA